MYVLLFALRIMDVVRSLLEQVTRQKQASDGPDYKVCGYRWMRNGRKLYGTEKTILARRGETLGLTFRRPAQR
jgi:hypothetical protein